jgi:hypothetical protein
MGMFKVLRQFREVEERNKVMSLPQINPISGLELVYVYDAKAGERWQLGRDLIPVDTGQPFCLLADTPTLAFRMFPRKPFDRNPVVMGTPGAYHPPVFMAVDPMRGWGYAQEQLELPPRDQWDRDSNGNPVNPLQKYMFLHVWSTGLEALCTLCAHNKSTQDSMYEMLGQLPLYRATAHPDARPLIKVGEKVAGHRPDYRLLPGSSWIANPLDPQPLSPLKKVASAPTAPQITSGPQEEGEPSLADALEDDANI